MGVECFNVNSLKIEILKVLQSTRHQHKFNLLGRGSDQGDFERQMGMRLKRSLGALVHICAIFPAAAVALFSHNARSL